jgi:hypothetical protein
MALVLTELKKQTKDVIVKVGNETIKVKYSPNELTSEMLNKSLDLDTILLTLVKDWDLAERLLEDGEDAQASDIVRIPTENGFVLGKKLPLNTDSITLLPLHILRDIYDALLKDIAPSKPTGGSFGDG